MTETLTWTIHTLNANAQYMTRNELIAAISTLAHETHLDTDPV